VRLQPLDLLDDGGYYFVAVIEPDLDNLKPAGADYHLVI
jgi:hypothetical protein